MELETNNQTYSCDALNFDLFIVKPKTKQKKLPAILIAHAWDGLNKPIQDIAHKIAALGYVAVGVDLYGQGVRGNPTADNSNLMNPLIEDRQLLINRLLASFQAIQKLEYVDETKIGAIGYCFGGLCVLDLARAAPVNLKGVVSFHGILKSNNLPAPTPIQAAILIEHGWDDPMATADDYLEFSKEMDSRKANWQAHIHGGTMHAFTFEGANKPEIGILYNKDAASRSWQSMINFFNEIL